METSDGEKGDGLEMISVGVVYSGPWEKKYWSSSRGKDRFPYPVGYHAVRTHAGNKYRMEIHEGLKGPLFLITSMDGESCSGQTPDIAWDFFQKRSVPRVKILHGKRYSCKVDGIELFGFRNPLVQRLLRELVASVNGMAEKSVVSPSFSNWASRLEHEEHIPDGCMYPDLISYLEERKSTKKRSRRQKNMSRSATNEVVQTLEEVHEDPESKSIPMDLTDLFQRGNDSILVKDDLVLESSKVVDQFVDRPLFAEGQNKLGRSSDSGLKKDDSFTARKESGVEIPVPTGFKLVSNLGNCVSDTLDLLNGKTIADSEGPITESNPEDGTGAFGSSNSNSEKSDYDSLQELAKSMMTVLLPRALPLLKNTYKRSKRTRSEKISFTSKNSCLNLRRVRSPAENDKIHHLIDSKSQGRTNKLDDHTDDSTTNVLIMERENFEDAKFVIPDSFEDDQHTQEATERGSLHTGSGQVNLSLSDKSDPNILQLLGNNDVDKGSSNCEFENKFSLGEVVTPPNHFEGKEKNVLSMLPNGFQEEDENLSPVSPIGCTSPYEDILFNEEVKIALDHIEDEAHLERGLLPFNNKKSEVRETNFLQSQHTHCPPEMKYKVSNLQSEPAFPDNLELSITAEKSPVKSKGEGSSFVGDQVGPCSCPLSKIDNAPPSENIICTIEKHGSTDTYSAMNTSHAIKNVHGKELQRTVILSNELELTRQRHGLTELQGNPASEGSPSNLCPNVSTKQAMVGCANDVHDTSFVKDNFFSEMSNHENELGGLIELVGSYVHPAPILSLLLCTKGNDIHICVLCGLLERSERTLFIYKVPVRESSIKVPSFLGYTSIMLPLSRGDLDNEIAFEAFGSQFTPDGQHLVLLNSIMAPGCRERNISCLCSACTSDSHEENAVKIVHVEFGYVSLVKKLKTVGRVYRVVVCEPNHLVAVEGGRLHVWVMNTIWSGSEEEFDLPKIDSTSSSILELKRIPNCASLVVGYNGLGDFGIWDISKQVLLARFCTPGISFSQICPVGMFNWGKKGLRVNSKVEDPIEEIIAATEMWFCGAGEDQSFLPPCWEDIAVWLLVSSHSEDLKVSDGSWRLALLVKDTVLLGSTLDPRASAANGSDGLGIIGTCDGLVYMWELSTGKKLGNLYHFKGGSVSHIATDAKSGALAVVGDECKLLLYLQSVRTSTKVN